MRIGRTIIIPAILALGALGSILAGSVAPAAVAQAPGSQTLAAASARPNTYYHA
jgi:hypothetical protein